MVNRTLATKIVPIYKYGEQNIDYKNCTYHNMVNRTLATKIVPIYKYGEQDIDLAYQSSFDCFAHTDVDCHDCIIIA